ncbi:PREDICTED: uncharacterized protein LOC105956663 [Erythranthe guttata]|uniref:uncharacterized protein LOC105956663 n=1 Tax=Erythranthe guttata TaxID=4155 RepID=UPI00064DBA0D|nr:PREDICTED: uncharacterized protein LOC105956663 [Erythranthe guttata]|eukprot:XP_012835988.1 PREDICTED: uncharacterized protein LOC105956663 [Erythranthe guttata]
MEDHKGLSDGVRVSDESKGLVVESSGETLIDGSGGKFVESGSLEINDKHDLSKNRGVDVTSRKKGWESWGVMDLVGRVLDGKFSMDEELEDVDDSKKPLEENRLTDTDACQVVIGEPKSENGMDVKGADIDKDSNNLDSALPGEGSGSTGNHDLVINETVPDVKMEIEEVNNVRADVAIAERHVGQYITETEGEYYASDLVWGKVRSHPWWPGQIFAPSAASDKATKYFKKESYLIAYFGDQTFAWNEGSNIKPFGMHFSQMEKQSSTDGFCHAVSCALDEVARRFELGLSCRCLPREVRDKIECQVVENAGIRNESSTRSGGDKLSSAASFVPGELLGFLESVAVRPQCKTDGLQLTVEKAQLLAFNRWKGYYQLPVLEACGGLLEDNVEGRGVESMEVMDGQRSKSTAPGGSSKKRKRLSGDEKWPKLKEKRLSVLMSSDSSSLQNDEKKPGMTRKKAILYPVPNNSRVKRQKNMVPAKPLGNSRGVEMIPAEIPNADVVLSKLIVAAMNPMEGHGIISPELGFLRQLRNFTCLELSGDAKIDSGKQLFNLEATNTSAFDGAEDSYWTDRIVQNYSQDQVLFQPEKPNKMAIQVEGNTSAVINANEGKESDAAIVDSGAQNPTAPVNEEVADEHYPTALILNFNNLNSIPPIENLNRIFSPYGPLRESETRVLSKSKRAKVIFKRREDADSAFSAPGKYEVFGPSLISYSLKYVKSSATSKRNKKGESSTVNAV